MLYKSIRGFFFLLLLIPSALSIAFENIDHTYAALLASGQTKKAKIVAEALFQEKSNNIELLDIIAELLWRGSKTELDIESDDLAWLAKSLGHSKLARYRQLLQQADANMAILEARNKPVQQSDSDAESASSDNYMTPYQAVNEAVNSIPYEVNHKKVRSYISDALKRLSEDSAEQYIAGTLDLNVLKERVERIRKANLKDRSQLDFTVLERGTSISDIYKKIGLPDHEGYHNVSRLRPFVGRVYFSQLQITYEDKGTIQFIEDGVNNGRVVWEVYRVFPVKKVVIYEDEPEGLIDKLKSNNPGAIRKAAKKLYSEQQVETETLDLVARVIWKYRNTDDDKMIDAIAWLCKVVGKSRNSRYQTLISEVAKTTENSKIERYAEKQLDYFEDEDVPQFLEYSQSAS
jgi:hypothetical protein